MARLSPTQAVEADRMWKAPDHQPPTPGPSHNRWKSRPPSATRDSHSYTQPRRAEPGQERKTKSYAFKYIYTLDLIRDDDHPSRPHLSSIAGIMDGNAPTQALTQTPPLSIDPSSWTATSPTRR